MNDITITITITPYLEENYLHVDVQGMGNYDNAVTMWSNIAQACEQYQCYNVLGEQNLLQTVTIAEAFDHPALFKKVGITQKHRIAWVDKNPRTRNTTEFIRDVLTSRSVGTGRLFNDVESAKNWLLSRPK
ncbi:hypothetical protein [Cellvibrio sp. NN19]|uniref:hypothetical protein n=1 Tax=Cellvibrio chitinivorans TaxID=3102792 RepID=UPI002B410FEF|nr:hypothetical protein [Cellvibrio sp. NN19]